jgi:hypothetical protein
MSLTPQDLDDLYTELCRSMTEAGDDALQGILARLVLLLMHEVDDAAAIRRAIKDALSTGAPR